MTDIIANEYSTPVLHLICLADCNPSQEKRMQYQHSKQPGSRALQPRDDQSVGHNLTRCKKYANRGQSLDHPRSIAVSDLQDLVISYLPRRSHGTNTNACTPSSLVLRNRFLQLQPCMTSFL